MSNIINIRIQDISSPLKKTYQIAYETVYVASNLVLNLQTNTGLNGYGCAAPDKAIGGETVDGVLALFHEEIEPYLLGKNPFQIAKIMAELRFTYPLQPSLLAMIDMALHDLLAKQAQLPAYRLLGAYRSSIPTSITIGILPIQETIEIAKKYIKEGFFILKIKGGINVNKDIEKICKLRESIGDSIQLRFDANQGYSLLDALYFVRQTMVCKVDILEQPSHKAQLFEMGEITKQTQLPIMADESLMNLRDAFKIAKNQLANMLNIKLMKVGGITQACHINSVAKAAKMEVMVGCMDECELGISAGLHFALALPNVMYADLDGHLELATDPTTGCFKIKNGIMYPLEQAAGFGYKGDIF